MKNKYILSTVILILLFLSLSIFPIIARSFGETVYLKAKAYSTVDSFKGDGLSLNYDIQEIDKNKIDKPAFPSNNRVQAYAILKNQGNYYDVDRITFSKPSNATYIKCYIYISEVSKEAPSDKIYVQYYLDNHYNGSVKNIDKNSKTDSDVIAVVKTYMGYGFLYSIQ